MTGVANPGQVPLNQSSDDEGMDDFDNLVGRMGGEDDAGSTPEPRQPTEPKPGQGQQSNQSRQDNAQRQQPPVRGQQGPATTVDPQIALHRLNQYETTLIPQYQRKLQESEQQLAQLRQTNEGVRQYTELMTQYGLKPEEAQIGLQMAAAYRRAPAEFLKSLINTTRANGVDLSSLGVQAGLDPNALNVVLDQKLKPIIDWFNQSQQQSEAEAQAERDLQQFFTQYPDAHVHQDEIAILMDNMNLDNVNAYYQLKMWAMQNQYDWSQPLTPQINARRAGPTNGSNFPATRRSNTYNQPVTTQDNEQFDVNAGWKDIARQVGNSILGT